MKHLITLVAVTTSTMLIWACGSAGDSDPPSTQSGTHTHADGTTHDAHQEKMPTTQGHAHDEAPIGTVSIGSLQVDLTQGHGVIAAGKEGHLVVKLPYSDKGETVVRAWLGTEDRTLSMVGRGQYAASPDNYDIHAVAPTPLPANTLWWIEITKPDGTSIVGSAKPIM